MAAPPAPLTTPNAQGVTPDEYTRVAMALAKGMTTVYKGITVVGTGGDPVDPGDLTKAGISPGMRGTPGVKTLPPETGPGSYADPLTGIVGAGQRQAITDAQNQPGGLGANGTPYSINPDGTLTITGPPGNPMIGGIVTKNGSITKQDGTPFPEGGVPGNPPAWTIRTPSGDKATEDPNFYGQNPFYNSAGTGLANTVPGVNSLVNLAKDVATPATVDTSGLAGVQNRAFQTQDQLNAERDSLAANPTKAPQSDLVQLDQTNIDPARARQNAALDQLTAAANGTVPSAAEILGKDQANRAASQAYGNAAALQGGASSGGALRQAMDAQTQIQGDANTQLIAARAKEMSDARNALVTGVGNFRTQESADATTNANLDQNKNLANTTAAVQTHGQDVTQEGDLITGQNTSLATGEAAAKGKADVDAANANSANVLKGAEISGVAGAISDRRAKTDIRSADLVQLAEDAPGYTFDYKDAADGPGKRVGVMAQDVQRSKLGKQLVQLGDGGKLELDGANSVGAALAMSAEALRKAEALKKRLVR